MTEKEEKNKLEDYAKEKFGVDLDKRKSLENLRAEVMELEAKAETGISLAEDVAEERHGQNDEARLQWLQDRAVAIWQGQSISLPIGERVRRIREAMKERGYSQGEIASIELPTKQDYKKFL